MVIVSIPLPADYATAYPEGTTTSQCLACGEIRVSVPGDHTDEWKKHSDYCEPLTGYGSADYELSGALSQATSIERADDIARGYGHASVTDALNWLRERTENSPVIPAHIPAGYCQRCANSGCGACDDFPNCPAGQ
jgi:hypothetical protein